MTFGVTPEGFKAKRFIDIIQEIGDNLKTELGIDINSDPDSVAKVLTNIYSLALAEEWELSQSLQSMFDIDKAEGKHLDDLVGYIGLTRLQAVASRGKEYISASKNLTIPANSVFKDTNGNIYNNQNPIIVSPSNCVFVEVEIPTTTPVGSILTIIINNITSSVNITTTIPAALALLVGDINNKSASNKVTALNTSSGGKHTFSITNNNDQVPSIITMSTNLVSGNVISFGDVVYNTVGEIQIEPNTVTIAPTISGITGVTNRYAFIVGRLQESDIDLRNRHKLTLSTAGSATVEAIRADLLRISGVTTVIVIENDTETTSVQGLPPKSFLAIVKGGLDQTIADTLWYDGKAAGIATYGNITLPVVDSQGNNQYVSFSRPTPVYIHMHVDYSLYDEQSTLFPADGEQQILNQILAYGDGLDIGEDVIPQRFSAQIFNNVGGLGVVNVTVGSTVGENDPTPPLSSNILSIDQLSEANFDAMRITFTEI